MLIMCLFLLSAVLALVLIAIYILQHFMLGKEPTLMVSNRQNWAVKWRTICCLWRGARSALAPACVCACVHDACLHMSVVCCACVGVCMRQRH